MRNVQSTKLSFNCKIIRLTDNGFSALENEYLIKFEDSRLKHYFKVGDQLSITLENTEKEGNEIVREGYSSFYVQLKRYLANGFNFMDVGGEPQTFFWDFRGFITHKSFESNSYWSKESIIRILIYRI